MERITKKFLEEKTQRLGTFLKADFELRCVDNGYRLYERSSGYMEITKVNLNARQMYWFLEGMYFGVAGYATVGV